MPVSDTLKQFRSGGYGEKKGGGGMDREKESPSGPRTIKLTDEEVKELQGYSESPGMEQKCLVTGRLGENGEFSVTSVHSPGGEGEGTTMPDQGGMAQELMNKMRPGGMMQSQTMPSPS